MIRCARAPYRAGTGSALGARSRGSAAAQATAPAVMQAAAANATTYA
jgi:hypothetical protein